MRKLLFGLVLILVSVSVAASHNLYHDRYGDPDRYDPYDRYSDYDPYDDRYDRNYDDRYRYDGYIPDDAYYSHSRYGSPYYDPVIYGGLGNYYYRGGYAGTGFPGSRYVPFGNIYRYEFGSNARYSGYGGYNSYGGYGSACLTGCPGYGAPINRPYGVGY